MLSTRRRLQRLDRRAIAEQQYLLCLQNKAEAKLHQDLETANNHFTAISNKLQPQINKAQADVMADEQAVDMKNDEFKANRAALAQSSSPMPSTAE